MTDSHRRAVIDLILVLLLLVPFAIVAWTTTRPVEALGLPALAIWFFCRRWVDVRVDVMVTIHWKEDNDDKENPTGSVDHRYASLR